MTGDEIRDRLRRHRPVIAPSLLACDFARLADVASALHGGGAVALHLDVMDGHFVPNLTYGPVVIAALRKAIDDLRLKLVLDTHLMIEQPEKHLDAYLRAGCDMVTVHAEACTDVSAILRRIRSAGRLSGLTLRPSTPLETVAPHLGDCDLLLVMSVDPGAGGQPFQPDALGRLSRLREMAGPGVLMGIDGGIKQHNLAEVVKAGADSVIAGTAVFGRADFVEAFRELSAVAESAARSD